MVIELYGINVFIIKINHLFLKIYSYNRLKNKYLFINILFFYDYFKISIYNFISK